MTTQLYRPGYRDLTFCGATADGRVLFTAEGAALLERRFDGWTPTDTIAIARELLAAASVADEFLAKARGEHLYRAEALADGRYLVHHGGTSQQMRPIRNSKRKDSRWAWKCTACRGDVATGEIMYVPGGEGKDDWRGMRICTPCIKAACEAVAPPTRVAFRGGA